MVDSRKRRAPFHAMSIRIMIYVIGFFVITFGIRTIIASDLGAGPWDTTTYNLHQLIPGTLGTAAFIVQATVMGVVLAYRRNKRFLLMIVPIIGIALALDFWDLIVFTRLDLSSVAFLSRTLMYVTGALIVTFGIALIIQSGFPAGVYDELMLVFMDAIGTRSIFFARVLVESLAITLALMFGMIGGFGLGQVNLGSVVLVFTIAPLLSWHMRWTGALMYETNV